MLPIVSEWSCANGRAYGGYGLCGLRSPLGFSNPLGFKGALAPYEGLTEYSVTSNYFFVALGLSHGPLILDRCDSNRRILARGRVSLAVGLKRRMNRYETRAPRSSKRLLRLVGVSSGACRLVTNNEIECELTGRIPIQTISRSLRRRYCAEQAAYRLR